MGEDIAGQILGFMANGFATGSIVYIDGGALVIKGEGLMEIAGKNHVVRKHDFIFLPPGVEHAISNSGLVDLVFLVITSPVTDDEKPV